MAIKRCHGVLGTTGWPAGGGAGRILQDGCVFGWHLASQDGFTALIKAAQGGHPDTVEVLLDRGADLEVKSWVSRARLLPPVRTERGRHGRAAVGMGAVSWRAGRRWEACGRCCRGHAARAVVVEGTWPRRMGPRRS